MSDLDQKKEIRRLRSLLLKMMELAEHVEQTGSFEGGVRNSVKRYNAIVERLEELEAIPEEIFHTLDEKANSGELGAEAMLLADFLNDMIEDEPAPAASGNKKMPDIGPLVALAPFLGGGELAKLIREHFDLPKGGEKQAASEGGAGQMNMRTIIGLAPHMKSEDLGQLVRSYLAQGGTFDPKELVALAPHMRSEDLSEILRLSQPQWFGGKPTAPATPTPPTPPAAPNVVHTAPTPPTPPPPQGVDWSESLRRERAAQSQSGSETGSGMNLVPHTAGEVAAPEPAYLQTQPREQ